MQAVVQGNNTWGRGAVTHAMVGAAVAAYTDVIERGHTRTEELKR